MAHNMENHMGAVCAEGFLWPMPAGVWFEG